MLGEGLRAEPRRELGAQPLADDHTIAVDTDVQLLPATNTLAAVFGRRSLAFAENGKTTAVDD